MSLFRFHKTAAFVAAVGLLFSLSAALTAPVSATVGTDFFVIDEVLLDGRDVIDADASSDGNVIVAVRAGTESGAPRDAFLFDRSVEQQIQLVDSDVVNGVSVSADGSLTAVAGVGEVLLFDRAGTTVGSVPLEDRRVLDIDLAGGSNQLAILYLGEVVIHDLVDGSAEFRWESEIVTSVCCQRFVSAISISDNGQRFLAVRVATQRFSATGYSNIVVDVASNTEIETSTASPGAISADGSTVAWVLRNTDGSGELEVVDLESGESQRLNEPITFDSWAIHAAVNRIALSSTGDLVAFTTTTALSAFDQAKKVPTEPTEGPTSSQDAYIWHRATDSLTFASVPSDANTRRKQVMHWLHLDDESSQLLTVRDGGLEVAVPMSEATLSCAGSAVTVNLLLGQKTTSGDDVVFGTPVDDRIGSRRGNDVVCAGSGDDVILGGEMVFAGDGADLIIDAVEVFGGDGQDTIRRAQTAHGEAGRDNIRGTNGPDFLFGGDGHDRISGGKGDDEIDGGAGSDKITGGRGNDSCFFVETIDSVRRCTAVD